MQSFLSILYCLLFVGGVVVLSLCGHWLYQKQSRHKSTSTNNEFAGIMFGAISVLYSLLIAFVIVAVWEDYEELNQTIEQEADKISNIIVHADGLPDSLQHTVVTQVSNYCRQVVQDWSTSNSSTPHQMSAIPAIRLLLLKAQPTGGFQQNLYDVLDEDLSNVSDLRRERLSHVRSHVPSLVWLMVMAGSIMLILFSYYIHSESLFLKQTGIGFLSALVAMSIFLVYMLDRPYTGSMAVSNAPYQKITALQRVR